MKYLSIVLPLALISCSGAGKDAQPESGSEADIAEKAADIRAQADTTINQHIAEIDAAANAEHAEFVDDPAPEHVAPPPENR